MKGASATPVLNQANFRPVQKMVKNIPTPMLTSPEARLETFPSRAAMNPLAAKVMTSALVRRTSMVPPWQIRSQIPRLSRPSIPAKIPSFRVRMKREGAGKIELMK